MFDDPLKVLVVAVMVLFVWIVCSALTCNMLVVTEPRPGWRRNLYELFRAPEVAVLGLLLALVLLMNLAVDAILGSPRQRALHSYQRPF